MIIIFNKAINLFILRTAIFEIIDLDISYYIALNYILNYFKKLLILFFIFFIKFKVEKLLSLNIPTKKAKKKIRNP